MGIYIPVETREGWIIRKRWTEPMVIPVGCLCSGIIQYGKDDADGALCTVPNTRDDQWVTHHSRDLVGIYRDRAHALRMIAAIEKEPGTHS